MPHDDVTLIIQGPVSHNGKLGKGILNIPTYKKFVGKIIISTWISPEVKPSKRFLINNDVTYLEDSPSKYESFFNWHNVNYQTVTSLNGVNKTKTEYVIKSRSDEYYTDLSSFIEKMKFYGECLITSEPFYREARTPRSISDHLMGGKTSKIKSMFTAVYEKCKNNEVQLTSPTYAPEDLYRDNFDGANITIKMNQLGQFWSKVGNNRITRKQYDENFSDGRRRVRR